MTAAALGILLLGERLELQAGIGMASIFFALALLLQTRRRLSRETAR